MKVLILNLVLLATTIICGCTTPLATFNSNSNGWKPGDFDPGTGVLLIQKTRSENQQKKIEAYMQKSYPYKYEFVEGENWETNSSKYLDKTTYRFALVYSYDSHTLHSSGGQSPMTVTGVDYNFIDRLNNKSYPKSGIASSWASMTLIKIIDACLKK